MSTPASIAVDSGDGHHSDLIWIPAPRARRAVLWLPALGVAARHYVPFAHAAAAHGVSVAIHEWRGHGSSSWRASRARDWGYRTLLERDIPASIHALRRLHPGLTGIGGHSLGGQLASCSAALAPGVFGTLWLVASGAPYWRAFPRPLRHALPLAYRFLPWLARRSGALPGRRIGFGGNEAATVMHDWSRTALSGRYAVEGWDAEIEAAMASLDIAIDAVGFDDDWLAPPGSLEYLLAKMPSAQARSTRLGAALLGTRADHFAWMQAPEVVLRQLCGERC